MVTREQGDRRIAAVTSALAAASLAGSLVVGSVAYATTTGSSSGVSTDDSPTTGATSGDDGSAPNGWGSQPSPGVNLTDDEPHASSGGS